MKTITIEGQLRTELGKKATRQLRSQELVPGVIYGGAQEINFSAPATAFKAIGIYTGISVGRSKSGWQNLQMHFERSAV